MSDDVATGVGLLPIGIGKAPTDVASVVPAKSNAALSESALIVVILNSLESAGAQATRHELPFKHSTPDVGNRSFGESMI